MSHYPPIRDSVYIYIYIYVCVCVCVYVYVCVCVFTRTCTPHSPMKVARLLATKISDPSLSDSNVALALWA
jgi:hypothetical protein